MMNRVKNISFYIVLTFLLVQSCDTTNYQFTPKQFAVIKDSLGKELVHQCSRPSPRAATDFFDLSENDINTLHKNLKRIYSLEPAEKAFKSIAIRDLEKYVYQYAGFVFEGSSYIYINAFPKELIVELRHDWKRFPLITCDGGPNDWGVLFDMDEERFYNLYMNGPIPLKNRANFR